MSDDRKATDILLIIESDVKEILAYVRNNDLNYRLILERLRLLSEGASKAPLAISPPSLVSGDTKPVPLSAGPFIQSSDLKEKIRKAMEEASLQDDNVKFQDLEVENSQSGKRRGTRVQINAEKQVSVQQKIVDSDGKNVFMAKVEIFDEQGNLAKQTKTNQTGKWLAQLLPGRYSVTITKAGTATKSPVESTYSVLIPVQETNCELDTKKV